MSPPETPRPLVAQPAAHPLMGSARVPGDKSISHRALMLGALAVGETRITGLLEGQDVLDTARALQALGAEIIQDGPGAWRVHGVGVGGLAEPADLLDMGNSGTGARLLMGIVAGHALAASFTGDASLRRRPMGRVLEPLTAMGATALGRGGGRLPLTLQGTARPRAGRFTPPVASAQVKSAILFCGLAAPGTTTVVEAHPTRDHSEAMLRHFGAQVAAEDLPGGGQAVHLTGEAELLARPVAVPADPSSAAFPLVAALLVPGSDVRLPGVGLNPRRTGLFETLREMGARIEVADRRQEGGEPVGDLLVRAAELRAVRVPAERAPSMIDEYPILAVAAACARGTTRLEGLAELRVKESDRLARIAEGLAACGVRVASGPDWLEVTGDGAPPPGGARVATAYDHRIAMAFLVLGLVARAPVTVDDGRAIATSFPDFEGLMAALGATVGPAAP